MIPGETILTGANDSCYVCGQKLHFKVLRSAAGWYIGTWCCEPHSRETGYFATSAQAAEALVTYNVTRCLPGRR